MAKGSIESYVHAQAVALYQSGLNLSKISKELKVSRCCVRSVVTKFEDYANFDDMKQSSRSKSLSDRNVRELKRLVQGNNRLSRAKITTNLTMSLSKHTVHRHLKKLRTDDERLLPDCIQQTNTGLWQGKHIRWWNDNSTDFLRNYGWDINYIVMFCNKN